MPLGVTVTLKNSSSKRGTALSIRESTSSLCARECVHEVISKSKIGRIELKSVDRDISYLWHGEKA